MNIMKYSTSLAHKRIRKPIVTVGIILLAFWLVYVVLTFPLSYPEGDKSIAESKARQIFLWKYFPFSLRLYEVEIKELSIPMLKNHSVFQVSGRAMSPPFHATLAVGRDGESYLYPNDFNKIIKLENVTIQSENQALVLVRAYFGSVNASKGYPYLTSYTEIPRGQGQDPSIYADTIKPPSITLEDSQYRVIFYSWRSNEGELKEWKFIINPDGTVETQSKTIAKHVGEGSTLQ